MHDSQTLFHHSAGSAPDISPLYTDLATVAKNGNAIYCRVTFLLEPSPSNLTPEETIEHSTTPSYYITYSPKLNLTLTITLPRR